MEEIKGQRNEFQSDGAEDHHQNGRGLGAFEGPKMKFWLKMIYGYMQNCVSYSSGEHIFRQSMKKMLQTEK